MDLMTFIFDRQLQWMLYQIYGNITYYGDVFISKIGDIATQFINFMVNNPIMNTIKDSLDKIQGPMMILLIVAMGYMMLLWWREETVGKAVKRIFVTMCFMALTPFLIQQGQDFVANAGTLAADVISGSSEEGGPNSSTMGLATALVTVNDDFVKCANSNPQVHGDDSSGSGPEKRVYDQTVEPKFIIGEWFMDLPDPADWYRAKQSVVDGFGTTTYLDGVDSTQIVTPEELATVNPTGKIVQNRYTYTACTTTNDGKVGTPFNFKWQLPNFLVGLVFSFIVFFAGIMAAFKVLDGIGEFAFSILWLPITVTTNLYDGMSDVWRNNVRAVVDSALGVFIQILVTGTICALLAKAIAEVPGWNEAVFGGQSALIKGATLIMMYVAIMLFFVQMIINGPDAIKAIFGYDTGAKSSAGAMMIGGALGAAGGWAAGKLKDKVSSKMGDPTEHINSGFGGADLSDEADNIKMEEDIMNKDNVNINENSNDNIMNNDNGNMVNNMEEDIMDSAIGASTGAGVGEIIDESMEGSPIQQQDLLDNETQTAQANANQVKANAKQEQDSILSYEGQQAEKDKFKAGNISAKDKAKFAKKAEKKWNRMNETQKAKYLSGSQMANGTSWRDLNDNQRAELSATLYSNSYKSMLGRNNKSKLDNQLDSNK